MSKQNLNRKMEIMRNSRAKSIITEMKNLLGEFNNRIKIGEESTNL